jgi:hypothetical protein
MAMTRGQFAQLLSPGLATIFQQMLDNLVDITQDPLVEVVLEDTAIQYQRQKEYMQKVDDIMYFCNLSYVDAVRCIEDCAFNY